MLLGLCSVPSVQFDVNLLFREPAPPSALKSSDCEDEGQKAPQEEARDGPEIEDAAWHELLIDEEDEVMSMMGYSE